MFFPILPNACSVVQTQQMTNKNLSSVLELLHKHACVFFPCTSHDLAFYYVQACVDSTFHLITPSMLGTIKGKFTLKEYGPAAICPRATPPQKKYVLQSQEAHHVWSPSRLPAVCSWFQPELYVTVASLWDTLSCVVSGSSILRIVWINCPDKKE